MANQDFPNFLEEWKQARDVLKSFDDKLHDLRKYGFSFLTALFTAEAIIIPKNAMPDLIKFVVFSITFLLISALHLLDKNYVAFQEAAATRAKVLERMLNLELTDIISIRYKTDGISRHELLIYFFLILGVCLLGWSVIGTKLLFKILLTIFACLAYGYILWQSKISKFYKEYPDDWMISPLECRTNESITIMVTNLNTRTKKVSGLNTKTKKKSKRNAEFKDKADLNDKSSKVPDSPLIFNKGDLILEIISQEDPKRDPIPIYAEKNIKVYDSYTMILERSQFGKKGLYKIRPRGRFIPLCVTIVVSDEDKWR